MCGIAGFIDFDSGRGAEDSQESLSRMLAAIRHRGPDEFGMFLDDDAALGNARLSIVDLEGGQQPMAADGQRYWIVYNGEIFNHAELRLELEHKGHRFSTRSDTEVALRMFVEDGPSCLQRFNGQFALAIWDRRDRELFVARDRVGIRPLFYRSLAGAFTFASEIKSLAAKEAESLELNPKAIDQVFTYWSSQPPVTSFEGVQQLPPGHYAVVRESGISTHRYWAPPFGVCPSEASESELLDELDALLSDATRLRLLADVPVGSYLSGGLDSSIIASLAREYAGDRLDTFSIAFSDSAYDESVFQMQMAQLLGTRHQVVKATASDIGEVFPEVVWHCETPLLRTAPAPMFLLSKLVRESNYKVVLTGEGADEFFGGYDLFKEAKIREFWGREPRSSRRPKLFERIYPDIQNLAKLGPRYLATFFGEGMENPSANDFSHQIRWRNTSRSKRFFSDEFRSRLVELEIDEIEYPSDFSKWGTLDKAQYLEVVTFMSSYLLSSQGDRVAMGNSVEGRYPFLDYRVSEFCGRLPMKFRMPGLRDKWLLRRLGKARLPDKIWNRPKKPYRAPIHSCFFHKNSPDYVREVLSERCLKETEIFNPVPVSRLIAKIDQGHGLGETDDMALVGMISTQLLAEQFKRSNMRIQSLAEGDDTKVCDFRGSERLSAN